MNTTTVLLVVLIFLVLILIALQVYRLRVTKGKSKVVEKDDKGLGLEEVVQSISNDIIKSQQKIREGGGKSIFFVDKAQVVISFVVKRTATGSVKLVATEVEGEYSSERLHQITLDLKTTPPLLDTLITSVMSKHKDPNKAIQEIDTLLSENDKSFIRQLQQPAGE